MNLYVMRHGKTVWNEKGIIQGRRQYKLSKTGKQQVEQQSQKMKNVLIDVIFASPLMRTMQTANIMNKFHNVKIIKDERIIEENKGIFSGRHKDSLTEEEKILKSKGSVEFGIETDEEVFNRVHNFLKFLQKNYMNKNVLVVTHNSPAKWLQLGQEIEVWDKSLASKYNFENAEIKHFYIDEK